MWEKFVAETSACGWGREKKKENFDNSVQELGQCQMEQDVYGLYQQLQTWISEEV